MSHKKRTLTDADWREYARCITAALIDGQTPTEARISLITDCRLAACRMADGQPRHSVARIRAARLSRLARATYQAAGCRWTGTLGGMVNPRLR